MNKLKSYQYVNVKFLPRLDLFFRYARKYSCKLASDIEDILDALSQYRELARDDVYINITKMNRYSGYFIETCEDFTHTKSTLYYETVDRPERILKLVQRLENIRKRKADLIQIKSHMLNALETLQNTSNCVTDGGLVRIQAVIPLTKKNYSKL